MKLANMLNEVMNPENSIVHQKLSYEEMAYKIAKQMMQLNVIKKPKWRPYIVQDGISYEGDCCDLRFDAKCFYPNSKIGDVVYTECNIFIEKDYELWINISGCVQVFLDGKRIFSSWENAIESVKNNTYINLPVMLAKGSNHKLVIKIVCIQEGFGYRLNLSPPRCPSLWANFYLVLARVLLPVKGLEKEEGMAVSPLYSSELDAQKAYEKQFAFEIEPSYEFPKIVRENEIIDFKTIYETGHSAFAYTIAETNGFLNLTAASNTKILINGAEKYIVGRGENLQIELQQGDKLLIKCMNEEKGWGFAKNSARGIALPMLDTTRKNEFSFALCGPFYQEGFHVKLPPEISEDIFVPFPDGCGGKVFWRLQNAYLRAYLDSSFYGQWYYATMLSFLGILRCGEILDNMEFVEYFLQNQKFLVDWYDYACYDYENFGFTNFMCSAAVSKCLLDNIGTMGVNFIEAYRRTGDRSYRFIIEKLKDQIKYGVSRFEDGTFNRQSTGTMWADDFFMSCPFLIRIYSEFGDQDCLKDVMQQLEGFRQRLYMHGERIFSHIFFLEAGVNNQIPWGRGNGWILLAMSEVLLNLSPQKTEFHQMLSAFCEFCEGIAKLQDKCGLWHQVLNDESSYLETSATAMYTLVFYRGIRNHWLPEKFLEHANRGLNALLLRCVDQAGTVYGVCMGSSCSMDVRYYFDLPSVKEDNHGTGILMMLLCERILYEREKKSANLKKWEDN